VAHHGLTLPTGAVTGIKGGWFGTAYMYPSEMAQNFWTAIFAWTTCFLVTILVSLATKATDEKKLVGLVYALTPHKPEEERLAWYARPASLAVFVLGATVLLNLVFW
jgi:SSS family solute:Na+ symporter